MTFEPQESEGPVIRDKRRVDPETGEVRKPVPSVAPDVAGFDRAVPPGVESSASDGASDIENALAERTADLQRLQAEYVNYKRRVDRDRVVVRDAAVANVLTALLPVLDDIGRAREHGEVTGGFKAVADSLERTVNGLGLIAFGAVGDAFDPHLHEALMHSYSDEVDGPVCQAVFQVGYRLGERIVRPARVAVVEPAESLPTQEPPAQEPAPGEPATDTDAAHDVEATETTAHQTDDEN